MNRELKHIITYARENFQFYRKLYGDRSFTNYKDVPTISKNKLLELYEGNAIDFGIDNSSQGMFARVTSGTSDMMGCFYQSEDEIEKSAERFKKVSYYLNQTQKDRVIIIHNYSLAYIFVRHFIKSGCVVSLGNPFDLEYTVEHLMRTKSNVIRTTPSIALRLIEMLNLRGYKNIDMFLLAGTGLSKAVDNQIKKYYPNAKIVMQYGMAETLNSMYQCKYIDANNFHTYDEDLYYEFITDEGKDAEAGDMGELIATKLTTDSPLIRYATGDIFLLGDICSCGKRIYNIIGRNDNVIKVNGVVVFKDKVEQAINKLGDRDYKLEFSDIEDDDIVKSKLKLYLTIKEGEDIEQIKKTFSKYFEIAEGYTWQDGLDAGIFEEIEIINSKFKGKQLINSTFNK
ncbi:hypothetical protein CMI37_05845 [Candidatus Pacearchaeota archaeon]|jgi:phenylacetate-coenzyme A ligase PaaK-like adenylate-forming protein|nr:hypothetical protein [Candidatus Pacearchaeota archaeon]|tara:strand:+ start:642 stop:1838 length:1197 start_codon:yes stop_codon:yes gene_type:complete